MDVEAKLGRQTLLLWPIICVELSRVIVMGVSDEEGVVVLDFSREMGILVVAGRTLGVEFVDGLYGGGGGGVVEFAASWARRASTVLGAPILSETNSREKGTGKNGSGSSIGYVASLKS